MHVEQWRDGAYKVDNKVQAKNAVFAGIMMLAAWIIPFIGIPLGSIGLFWGITGKRSSRIDLARAGIFLNGLGLFLTASNMFISAYLLISANPDLQRLLDILY